MNYLLILHIAAGFITLLTGTTLLFLKKGNSRHKLLGNIFHYSMLVVGISAIILSIVDNIPFLLAVGIFSTYLATSGRLCVKIKASKGKSKEVVLWVIVSSIMVLSDVALLVLAATMLVKGSWFGLVPLMFAVGVILMLRQDYLFIYKQIRSAWLSLHIQRMSGALIATYTAFLVTNVKFLPMLLVWVSPSILGIALITYYLKKYTPSKVKKA